MGRIPISNPRVKELIDRRLIPMYVQSGCSMRALGRALAGKDGGNAPVHVNQISRLLCDEPTQAINEATLVRIEKMVEATWSEVRASKDLLSEKIDDLRKEIFLLQKNRDRLYNWNHEKIPSLSKKVDLPPAVVRFLLEQSPQSNEPQKGFLGRLINYRTSARHSQDRFAWGAFYVCNPKRSGRKRPLNEAPCPFCEIARNRKLIQRKRWNISIQESIYDIVMNKNPIVTGQLVAFPLSDNPTAFHRSGLDDCDIHLMQILVDGCLFEKASSIHSAGFESSLVDTPKQQTYAVYVNPFSTVGRSQEHLHLNAVPTEGIALPRIREASWIVASDTANLIGDEKEALSIMRAEGLPFYALTMRSESVTQLARFLSRLHGVFDINRVPYNLLGYFDAQAKPRGLRILVVPRSREVASSVNQRVGGLELLTGVLIPGQKQLDSMNIRRRRHAFQEVCYRPDGSDPECFSIERLLRREFGLPPSGHAICAEPDLRRPGKFLPELRDNPVLEGIKKSDCWKKDPNFHLPTSEDMREPNVLVRVLFSSICQSDRRILAGDKLHHLEMNLTLGHEAGGRIVDAGPWHSEPGFKPGTLVAILPHSSCGICLNCRLGKPNKCRGLEHLGFHMHGTFVDLGVFPRQAIFPVGKEFPEDALPLVEPLGCVFRAIFKIKDHLKKAANVSEPDYGFVSFGGGPMGALALLLVRRLYPKMRMAVVEPKAERRSVLEKDLKSVIGQDTLQGIRPVSKSAISFVASSALEAYEGAIEAVRVGGCVVAFSGINLRELRKEVRNEREWLVGHLERLHRKELTNQGQVPLTLVPEERDRSCLIIGSSGYTFNDIHRSVNELKRNYCHYNVVQNVEIKGLDNPVAHRPDGETFHKARRSSKNNPASALVDLLARDGVDDEHFGSKVAKLLKVKVQH